MSFSPMVLEHVARPRNVGPLSVATHIGTSGVPGEGPYVTLWLNINGDRIVEAAYETYGCPAAIASASLSAQLLSGRSIDHARLITAQDLIQLLGGLPEGKGHCPQMAVDAIRAAIDRGAIL